MKSKKVYFFVILFIFVYIFFWTGVSVGKSFAGVKKENVGAGITLDTPGPIENIQCTYEYESIEAEGYCSGCATCGARQIVGQYIEISGVGFLPVKKEDTGRIRIYFDDCETAEEFGVQNVYVRRCDYDL